ncbi:hypothetical protein QG37_00843 [Candidozyma auris]|uniref:Uncharacterized protein n=1 Tax=Candidozyma auris TaxID=498019 RepID=A0A0L0P823_CANAR|nr:hypothetical protein QG37_00843 [[Candida] auris]
MFMKQEKRSGGCWNRGVVDFDEVDGKVFSALRRYSSGHVRHYLPQLWLLTEAALKSCLPA